MVDVADPKSIIVTSAPKLPLRLVLAPTPTPASTLYTRLSTAAKDPTPLSTSLSFDSTLPPPKSTSQTSTQSVSPTLSRFDRLPVGSRMEISPASWEVVRGLGKLVNDGPKGGAGLVVDYGDGKGFGRSWRVSNTFFSVKIKN